MDLNDGINGKLNNGINRSKNNNCSSSYDDTTSIDNRQLNEVDRQAVESAKNVQRDKSVRIGTVTGENGHSDATVQQQRQ